MKEKYSKGWQFFLICLIFFVVMFFIGRDSFGVTVYPTFVAEDETATGGNFKIFSNTTGDSLAYDTLTEVATGAITIWKGTASITELGEVTVVGYVWNGSDTDRSVYTINTATDATLDSLEIVLDSLEALETWVFSITDSALMKNIGEVAAEFADSASAASVDYDLIKAAVWNDTSATYTTAGTFGAYLDVAVSSISGLSGSGAYTVNIVVVDSGSTTDSVVTNGKVYVNNYAQNATPYQADLNNNGVATFNLDAGNWVRFTTRADFATNLDSFTVSATATETLYVYDDAGSKTTLAWQLDKPNGLPYANARISINLVAVNDSMLYVSDTVLPSASWREIVGIANDDGLFSIDLYPNDSISGDSTYYKITVRDSRRRYIIDQFSARIQGSDTTVWTQYLTRW